MNEDYLRDNSHQTLLELITDEGINASGKEEIYGCIFGRDSAITILKILNFLSRKDSDKYVDREFFLKACRRSLLTLAGLQGIEFNIESGEEPGKFIHEYRKEKFAHLIERENPWFVYPDGKLRNYDSIDSTPLALVAMYKYWELASDGHFLLKVLPAVEKGLKWLIKYGDLDKDYLLEYEFKKNRKSGGLLVQSWTDSQESVVGVDGNLPLYPIAPVEVQGYAWLALRLWTDFFQENQTARKNSQKVVKKLLEHSSLLKKRFNESFMLKNSGMYFPAQALDGNKKRIETVTGNPLLLLWATYSKNGAVESIIDDIYVKDLVKRAFMPDLFDGRAGFRTMSTLSPTFNPGKNSYHNGSFWPKLNGMAHEGLLKWGFLEEARVLRKATLLPINYFKTPIELYVLSENNYAEYVGSTGQESCRKQAWSAASILDLVI